VLYPAELPGRTMSFMLRCAFRFQEPFADSHRLQSARRDRLIVPTRHLTRTNRALKHAPMSVRAASLAAAFFAALLLPSIAQGAALCPGAGEERAIASGVGERGEILLADGRRARLAGLDIPDPGRGDAQNAAKAKAWLVAHLVGRTVGLHRLGAKPDRWGRWLVDLSSGDNGASESLSLGLLAAGLARVRPEVEAKNCLAERLAAEASARSNGLGLWADPYYGVVQASDVDNLRQRDGQFAIVEGVVLRVGEGRSRIWLDFGRRGGFSAVAATRQAKTFERGGVAISALAGLRIRVRGAMDNRFGLRMAISDAGQIEILSQAVGKSETRPDP
jgi:endonuclease YncB( thermonuclease family)